MIQMIKRNMEVINLLLNDNIKSAYITNERKEDEMKIYFNTGNVLFIDVFTASENESMFLENIIKEVLKLENVRRIGSPSITRQTRFVDEANIIYLYFDIGATKKLELKIVNEYPYTVIQREIRTVEKNSEYTCNSCNGKGCIECNNSGYILCPYVYGKKAYNLNSEKDYKELLEIMIKDKVLRKSEIYFDYNGNCIGTTDDKGSLLDGIKRLITGGINNGN